MKNLRPFLPVAFAFTAASSLAADRVALVIGNNAYSSALPLSNPIRDSEAIGQQLKDGGWHVTPLRDAGVLAMRKALRTFCESAQDAEAAMVFFAGHGLEVKGKNYLLPIDVKLSDEDGEDALQLETLGLDEMLNSLGNSGARLKIVVLDSCRSNPLDRSWLKVRSGGGGFAAVSEKAMAEGTMLVFSTAPGKTASDGQGTNSPFTSALVARMKKGGGAVDIFTDASIALGETQQAWIRFDGSGRSLAAFRGYTLLGENSSGKGEATGSSPNPNHAAVSGRKGGMVRLSGGTFMMGHDGSFETPYGTKTFPEEGPAHKVTVKGFWIDETEVTNAQFAEFVKATKYVTFAEREVKAEDFPEEARGNLPGVTFNNGSIVFREDAHVQGDPNIPGRSMEWWKWEPTANWQHPTGKDSSIAGKENYPVVCVIYEDAVAYAKWAGKRLPTEAEWEYAARGGREGKIYTWGDELKPGDKWMANSWQGEFPNKNNGDDGYKGSSPAKTYPANGYGLHDMAGNVWELCGDLYDPTYFTECDPDNPQGPKVWVNRDTGVKGDGKVHRVTKGGSFLCHVSYCMRYRPAARHSQDSESPTNHTGFRCVKD